MSDPQTPLKLIHREITDPKAKAEALVRFVAGTLMPTNYQLIFDRNIGLLPLLWVDASSRLDVSDAPRAVRAEFNPDNPIFSTWTSANMSDKLALIKLSIEYVKPVGLKFQVLFEVNKNFGLLVDILKHRRVAIIPSPSANSLAFEVETHALEEILRIYHGLNYARVSAEMRGGGMK